MTNRRALEAAIGFTLDENTLDKALLDADLTPEADYSKEEKLKLDEATLYALLSVKHIKSISEGALSASFDLNAINERLLLLARATGKLELVPDLVPQKPTIRAVNVW